MRPVFWLGGFVAVLVAPVAAHAGEDEASADVSDDGEAAEPAAYAGEGEASADASPDGELLGSDPDAPPPPPPPLASGATPAADEPARFVGAVGLASSVLRRNDYGDRMRNVFIPEVIGFAYVGVAERLYLRPGARLGFARFGAAEMPGGLRFSERDTTAALELGLLYDGFLIPTIAGGAGVWFRHVELGVGRAIETQTEPVSGWEALPTAHLQFALGIPLAATPLVLEPFARFEHIVGDDRSSWRFGLDITVEISN